MKAPQAHVAGGENTKALRRNAADAAAPQTSSRARRHPATAQEGLELRTAILDHEDALAVLRDRIFALRCSIRGASLANEEDRRGLIQISEDISDAIGQAITALQVAVTRKMGQHQGRRRASCCSSRANTFQFWETRTPSAFHVYAGLFVLFSHAVVGARARLLT